METPLQLEDESRRRSPPWEAMDKSLKVEEDELRERKRRARNLVPLKKYEL